MRNITILNTQDNTQENIVTNAPAEIISSLAKSIAQAAGTNFIKVLLDTLTGCGYAAISANELFA